MVELVLDVDVVDVLLLVEVDDVELLVVVVLVPRHTRQNRFQISL